MLPHSQVQPSGDAWGRLEMHALLLHGMYRPSKLKQNQVLTDQDLHSCNAQAVDHTSPVLPFQIAGETDNQVLPNQSLHRGIRHGRTQINALCLVTTVPLGGEPYSSELYPTTDRVQNMCRVMLPPQPDRRGAEGALVCRMRKCSLRESSNCESSRRTRWSMAQQQMALRHEVA